MKKLIIFLTMTFLPVFVRAYDVKVDLLYYDIDTQNLTASVTRGDDSYSFSSIEIPSHINVLDKTFEVTEIGYNAFRSCTKLESIILPKTLKRIKTQAFYECSSLISIDIPNNVSEIGVFTFWGCKSLTTVTLSQNISVIPSEMFHYCSALTDITIPESVKTIEYSAFMDCTSLKTINLPKALTRIDWYCFAGCKSLESIILPNGITKLSGGTFSGCENLVSVQLPQSLETIEGRTSEWTATGVFKNCYNLRVLNLPNSLRTIDKKAFEGTTNLESITIPESVTTIKEQAFAGCNSIQSITSFISSPFAIDSNVFETSVKNDATLYVPHGKKQWYMLFQGWKEFSNIVEMELRKFKIYYYVDEILYKEVEQEEESQITPEAAPTKEGYTFSGWSEIPETMPAHDVTVTGTFSINSYKLTYTVDGEEFKSTDVQYGAVITPEKAPTKEGYIFSGWSEIPATMPAHDVTITGTFSINSYKLTYTVDGEEFKSTDVQYGAVITPEKAPTKEGYIFSGWSEIPTTMPAHDVTVTGTFTLDTGIEMVQGGENGKTMIFTLDGRRIDSSKKGLNIVRMSNGTTKKIIVK